MIVFLLNNCYYCQNISFIQQFGIHDDEFWVGTDNTIKYIAVTMFILAHISPNISYRINKSPPNKMPKHLSWLPGHATNFKINFLRIEKCTYRMKTFSPTLVPDNKGRVSSDLFTPHPGRWLDKSSVADGQLWTGLTGGVAVANIDLCEAT